MRRIQTMGLLFLLGSCVYTGSAKDFDPNLLECEPGWIAVSGVPVLFQEGNADCGPAALRMVISYWGIPVTEAEVERSCPLVEERGARARDLRDFARQKGLQAFLFHGSIDDLQVELRRRRPIVVGMIKPLTNGAASHYQVVVAVHPETKRIVTLDPAQGWQWDSFDGFSREWGMARNLTIVFFPVSEKTEQASSNRKVMP